MRNLKFWREIQLISRFMGNCVVDDTLLKQIPEIAY